MSNLAVLGLLGLRGGAGAELWTWGYNLYGQLADGTVIHKSSPVQVGSLTDWSSVAGGSNHSLATKS